MTQEQKGAFITFGKALGAAFMASITTASMMLIVLDRLYATKAELAVEQLAVSRLDGAVTMHAQSTADLKAELMLIRSQLREIEQKVTR